MSAPITVWNTNSTPVQIDSDGTQLPGLNLSVVDPEHGDVKRLIKRGVLVVVAGAVEQDEQAIVAPTEAPAEQAVEEVQAESTPAEAESAEQEAAEEEPKVPKTTRKQSAGKES